MNKLFFVGKIISIIAILVCLDWFLLGIFFTCYIIALTLIWLSKEKVKQKILWSIIPIFGGALFLIFTTYMRYVYYEFKSLKVDYILTESFKGEIIVYDNITCGQSKNIENNRIVINVPQNGVVYYSGDLLNEGYIDNVFKRRRDSGFEILNNFHSQRSVEIDKISTGNDVVFSAGHYSYEHENGYFKELFVVTDKDSINLVDWHQIFYKKIDELKQVECNLK